MKAKKKPLELIKKTWLQVLLLSLTTSSITTLTIDFRFDVVRNIFLHLLSFLPAHQLQTAITLSVLFPLILTSLSVTVMLYLQKKSTQAKQLLLSLLGWLLANHFVIWWLVRPGCISGCEGGAGGNDGYDTVWMVTLLTMPIILAISTGFYFLVQRSQKNSIKPNLITWNTIFWTVYLTQITLFLITG